ncbi:MAG: polyamine aminopropyltransferase [Mycoplasmoidaceae bacterium]|nr:MAG: polyamine aminopropyltransferase [Mycoplasmoidaceae bacterium]
MNNKFPIKRQIFTKKDIGKKVYHIEEDADDVLWCIEATLLDHVESKFQVLDVYQSKTFGKFFTLDGWMQYNEKDEFIYQEMMCHTAFATNPSIDKVLVIGGGDGGVVREVCKYKNVKKIDWIDIDEEVVKMARKHFPSTAFTDKRVNFMPIDGIDWVKKSKDKSYDLIVVDSTDPTDAHSDDLCAASLFTKEFYANCERILTPNGILTCQGESPYYQMTINNMKRSYSMLKKTFKKNVMFQYFMPSYSSGWWITGFAMKNGKNPVGDFKRWNALKIKTKFFNEQVYNCSLNFMSNYVKDLIKDIK